MKTMPPTTVILITGHPGSGKTTLARTLGQALGWPALCKDEIKEILYDTVGWADAEAWNRLSIATWTLLYHQVETLLAAHTPHIVEANFVPQFADSRWQGLQQRFKMHVIQVRCEGDAAVLLARYRARIEQGARHPGHRDGSDDPAFFAMLRDGPIEWVDVPGERIPVNTTELTVDAYGGLVERLRGLHAAGVAGA